MSVLEVLVIAAAIGTVPVVVLLEQGVASWWIRAADWLLWAVFLAEYLAVTFLCDSSWPYVRQKPLYLAVTVISCPALPDLFGLVRLVRLGRLLRLVRLVGVGAAGLSALRATLGRHGLVYMAATTAFLVLIGGAGLALVEPSRVPGGLVEGVWWALITASTVGYGDIVPATPLGRFIAVILIIAGMGLMSTLAASIAAYFVAQDERRALSELTDQLARIEQILSMTMPRPDHRPEGPS